MPGLPPAQQSRPIWSAGKPHLWARCDKHGWLWKRAGRQGTWTRHWIVVKGSLLVVFPDDKVLCLPLKHAWVFAPCSLRDITATGLVSLIFTLLQEQEPLEAFRLHPGSAPSEDSLSEAEAPRTEADSDSEETQGLLSCHLDSDQDKAQRLQRVWFAAESEKQHLSWHSKSRDFATSQARRPTA